MSIAAALLIRRGGRGVPLLQLPNFDFQFQLKHGGETAEFPGRNYVWLATC